MSSFTSKDYKKMNTIVIVLNDYIQTEIDIYKKGLQTKQDLINSHLKMLDDLATSVETLKLDAKELNEYNKHISKSLTLIDNAVGGIFNMD